MITVYRIHTMLLVCQLRELTWSDNLTIVWSVHMCVSCITSIRCIHSVHCILCIPCPVYPIDSGHIAVVQRWLTLVLHSPSGVILTACLIFCHGGKVSSLSISVHSQVNIVTYIWSTARLFTYISICFQYLIWCLCVHNVILSSSHTLPSY